ncbi:MAG: tetratricopeptide repeat protein [Fibromonadaceae bacterium]|nr:tetratricopeptide repeat protein [Fibromonadaceae bacterium]
MAVAEEFMEANKGKRDFFISYNKADKQRAEWIATVLEQNGYSCYIQAWDFRLGGNFVSDMQKALTKSERFIAVLSPNYLDSMYCQAEWAAAFTKDLSGEKRLFIPVRVSDVEPKGLLAGVVYIDLFGVEEKIAEERLLNGVDKKDIPRHSPSYSGTPKARFPDSLPFNNLPFVRNIYFTGRDSIFEDIYSGFESGNITSQIQVITGMGGFGKTQTALEYAYRYANKYDYIWWVQAETDATVLMSYKNFAVKMKLLNEDQQDSELIIETVLSWMSSHSKWLFIYDNADITAGNTTWLPKKNHENILITTRNTHNDIGNVIRIDVLKEKEAVAFLKKRTGIKDSSNASKLADCLGYFPLALEQAATYIKTNEITYIEYLSLFKDYGLEVLEKIDRVTNYESSVAATLEISFKKIEQEASLQLLYLCSYMAPEDIDEMLFSENSELLPSPLREMMADRLDRNDIWNQLTRYSLLNKQEGGKGYSMHRLLQEIMRNKIGNELQWAQCCLSLFRKAYDFEYGNIGSHNRFLDLTPHVEVFLSIAKMILATNEEQEEIAYLYHEGGFGNRHLGNYNRALEWYRNALAIREKVLGKGHLDTATTYNNMALVFHDQGDYVKALEYYGYALAIREKALGNEHPSTATTYNNMALVFHAQGDYVKALEYYGYALVIREKVLGKEHPSTATTYNNMAAVFHDQGDYAKALEYYGYALAILEKVLGKEHPSTAATYNGMAAVFHDQGDYAKALEYYGYALEIYEKVLGEEHPSTAATYNGMALVFHDQGDYAKALEYYGYALVIREKVLGKEHPDTVATYNGRVAVFHVQGGSSKSSAYDDLLELLYQKMRDLDYRSVFSILPNLKSADEERYIKLIDDFAYIFSSEANFKDNEDKWNQHNKPSIDYKVKLWSLLTFDLPDIKNETELASSVEKIIEDTKTEVSTSKTVSELKPVKKSEHPQKKGERLELSVIELLRELFDIDEEENERLVTELRRQKAGSQFGFDIQIRYKDDLDQQCICKIECKDQKNISLGQITEKLENARRAKQDIHHWIFISPNEFGQTANDLNDISLDWEHENRYYPPIHKIQFWTRDNNVEEFFALSPDIHEHYYSSNKTIYPETWNKEERIEVLKKWREKLAPAIPLPRAWKDYLLNNHKLLTFSESGDVNIGHSNNQTSKVYKELYKDYAPIICQDESFNLVSKSTEQHLINWVYESGNSNLFLLGDFGDGKTFLTYSLACKLAEDFIKSTSKGVIPLRLSLRDLKKGTNAQTFLRDRLDSFGANLKEWDGIINEFKVLIILDGFDEMSVGMDRNTMAKNVSRLWECINYYKGKELKIIITSRISVFRMVKQHLIERTKPSKVLYLANINNNDKIEKLSEFAKECGVKEKRRFDILRNTHDLMGIASKPLFFDMMKLTILDGEIEEVNSLSIYDNYVKTVLNRKIHFQFDRDDDLVDLENTVADLEHLLENFAIVSFMYPEKGASLDDLVAEFDEYKDRSFAEHLWKNLTSPTSNEDDDARNRILNRSLLKETEEGRFLFCHRSMQEYFMARGICRLIIKNPVKAERILSTIDINPETLGFASQKLKKFNQNEIEIDGIKKCLTSMVEKTRYKSSDNKEAVLLGKNAINLYFSTWKELPDIDWSNLVLDNAYLPEADFTSKILIKTSLRNANLDNANFTRADLSGCDLTGVKFEETKDIYAMKIFIEDKPYLYALYSDGKLRKWDMQTNRALELALLDTVTPANFSISSFGLLFFQKERVHFSHRPNDYIEIYGGVNHDENKVIFDTRDEKILFSENNQLSYFDLKNESYIFESYSITEQSRSIIVDDTYVIVYNDISGPRIVSTHEGSTVESCFIENLDKQNAKDITAISAISNDSGEVMICVGNKEGCLAVYKLKNIDAYIQNGNSHDIEKVDIYYHPSGKYYIKSICFWDLNCILYTGTDGIIHVLKTNEHGKLIKFTEWKLAVKCEGAIINGVKQEEQRKKLEYYLTKVSAE